MNKLIITVGLCSVAFISALTAHCPYGGCAYDGYGPRGYHRGYQAQPMYQDRYYYYDRGYQAQPLYQDRYYYYDNYQSRAYNNKAQNNEIAMMDHSGSTMVVSDQEIDKGVKNALGSDYADVTYTVVGGQVTLRGNVKTLEDKNKIEASVMKVKGVQNVNNEITVVPAQ